jgi:uncharacterized protein
VGGRVRIAIGGNVDAEALDDCRRLLDRLMAEPFAASISKVNFKPILKVAPARPAPMPAVAPTWGPGSLPGAGSPGRLRLIPLTPAEAPPAGACDTCAFADDAFGELRRETTRRGFPTPDGVHMGPCELHRRHSHAVGPDGTRFFCPGYATSAAHAIGHVRRQATPAEQNMAARKERFGAWRACGECAYVPVCAGGCSVAAHHEQHDMEAPACHRPAFEAAAADLARTVVEEIA